MYAEYLSKLAQRKQNGVEVDYEDVNMEVDNQMEEFKQSDLQSMDIDSDFKGNSKSMKTGEKYIIKKLISFKINIPKIDDYISKLEDIKVKEKNNDSQSIMNQYNTGMMNGGMSYSNTSHNMYSNYGPSQGSTMYDSNNSGNFYQSPYFKTLNNAIIGDNSLKTMQGFNDDSQIAFQTQHSLFQQPLMPMPNMHSMMNYNNATGMQNLGISNTGNCYWGNFMNPAGTVQQMPMSVGGNSQQMPVQQNSAMPQPSQSYPHPGMPSSTLQLTKSNMHEFVFGQSSQNQSMFSGMQGSSGVSAFKSPGVDKSINSQLVQACTDNDYFSPAPMRLPSHMTKLHHRSNSVTPVDTGSQNAMNSNFLFDQMQSSEPRPKPVLNKICSEDVHFKGRHKIFESCNSLPAIRNISDYYESMASDSSVFDGNDSALASSLDLSIDEEGQPIFHDNNSESGDNSRREEGSEGVPLKSKKLKRVAVKSKSGFCTVKHKKDHSGSEYSNSDDCYSVYA